MRLEDKLRNASRVSHEICSQIDRLHKDEYIETEYTNLLARIDFEEIEESMLKQVTSSTLDAIFHQQPHIADMEEMVESKEALFRLEARKFQNLEAKFNCRKRTKAFWPRTKTCKGKYASRKMKNPCF